MKAPVTRVVATGLIEHPGGILLLRRARNFGELDRGRGLWEPPGGSVDSGETIEVAMRREVREETGIEVPAGPALAAVVNYMIEDVEHAVHRVHVLYRVRVDGVPTVTLGDEHDAVIAVRAPSELDDLDMVPEMRDCLRSLLAAPAR